MENQCNPLNHKGRKQYDREFLVKLQSIPMSMDKPSNLPKLDIVKDKAHLQMVKSMTVCKSKEELIEKSSKSNKKDLNSAKLFQNYEGCSNKETEILPKSSGKQSLLIRFDALSLESHQNNSKVFYNPAKTLSQRKGINNTEKDSVSEVSHTMIEKADLKKNLEPQTKIKVFGLKSAADLKKGKVDNKTNNLIEDFLNSNDLEGTTKKAAKVISCVGSRTFIASSIKLVLKRSIHERQMVGQLFFSLAQKDIVTMKQFRIGLRQFMRPVDLYFASDVRVYVGEILEPLLSLGKTKCKPMNNLLRFFIPEKFVKLSAKQGCAAKETSSKSDEMGSNSVESMLKCEGCSSEEIEIQSKLSDINIPSLRISFDDSSLESDQASNYKVFSNSAKTLSSSKLSTNTVKDSVSGVIHNIKEKTDVKKNEGFKSTAELKENEIELKIKVLIADFLLYKNFERTIKKVTELISFGYYSLIITSSINQVIKTSSQRRWLVGRLFFHIVKQDIITLENYSEGLVKFVESIDMNLASEIWNNIAEILEPILSLEKNYFRVLKKLLQPYIPSEIGENLISAVLRNAVSRRGISALMKKWEKTELQWTDFLGKEANIDEFLLKNGLKVLASHKNSISTTKQKASKKAPTLTEESTKYLFNFY